MNALFSLHCPPSFVIPAQAGIDCWSGSGFKRWTPAFALGYAHILVRQIDLPCKKDISKLTGECDFMVDTLDQPRCRHVEHGVVAWSVRGSPPRQRGAAVLERMVARKSVCLRRLARGRRSEIIRYGRFLANPKVSVAALLEGWGEQTAGAAKGRHVLAIQDTSEINFHTSAGRQRGLGESARALVAACWCMRWWRWTQSVAAGLGWSRDGCGRAGPGCGRA